MVAAGRIADLRLPELAADRAEVFPGGVAILVEVMRALALERMTVADGALREGILYDMIGRLTDEDARVRTVRAMAARYQVDLPQAERVEATALNLYAAGCAKTGIWSITRSCCCPAAARLHELGLDIAHAHYHRHGAYVLENADMPRFPARGAADSGLPRAGPPAQVRAGCIQCPAGAAAAACLATGDPAAPCGTRAPEPHWRCRHLT